MFRSCLLRVDGKMERNWQKFSPFFELVVELRDDVGEAGVVERDAGFAGVEEVVHAVKETAHGDAGEEVEAALLFFGGVGVGIILAGKGDGGFDVGDAGLREGGEFSEVVAVGDKWDLIL